MRSHEGILIDAELDDMVEAAAALREQQVERFGLGARARIAVEDRAGLAHVVEALADERADDRVADQLARLPSPPWP